MSTAEWLDLFAYDRWAGRRLLAACEPAGDAFRSHAGHGVGSARDLLVHVGDAQSVWLSRLAGTAFERQPLDRFASVAEIDAHLDRCNAGLTGWIGQQGDTALAGDISFSNLQGQTESLPGRIILMQLYTHGVGHRAEASELLTAAGSPPEAIDYMVYQRQLRAGA